MRTARIKGVGAYVPEPVVSNDMLAGYVDTSDEWIFSRTGIHSRHMSRKENTSELAAGAARRILEHAGAAARDVQLIIVATVTPDYATPSTACLVQNRIGAAGAAAFDLGAACSGFVYALSTADKFIRSGACDNALVIGAEVMTKHLDFADRSTCVLFGDGAAGVFLEAGEGGGITAEDLGSDGSRAMSLTAGYHPVKNLLVQNEQEKGHGTAALSMDGREVFQFAVRETPRSIKRLMEKAHLDIGDVDWIIPHQANGRIVDCVAKKLALPAEKFYKNMERYGNTSSASIPLALWEMWEKGLLQRGSRVILTGFGAGFTWGSLLLEL